MRRIIVVPLEKPPVERNPESERGIALCGVTQTFTDFVFGQKDLKSSNKIRKSRNSYLFNIFPFEFVSSAFVYLHAFVDFRVEDVVRS